MITVEQFERDNTIKSEFLIPVFILTAVGEMLSHFIGQKSGLKYSRMFQYIF